MERRGVPTGGTEFLIATVICPEIPSNSAPGGAEELNVMDVLSDVSPVRTPERPSPQLHIFASNVPTLVQLHAYLGSRGWGFSSGPVDRHVSTTPGADCTRIPNIISHDSCLIKRALRSRPHAAREAHVFHHRLADRSTPRGHRPPSRHIVTGSPQGHQPACGERVGYRPAKSSESLRHRAPPSPLRIRSRRSRTRTLGASEPREARGALGVDGRASHSLGDLSASSRDVRDVSAERRVREVITLTTGSASLPFFFAARSAHFLSGRGVR